MDLLRACVLSLLLVAVAAAPQEDGKRTQGRFYISLSDIPILGSLFTQYTGNGTASNKTSTLKQLQLYPILPSRITTSGEQPNASGEDANSKANCNQHNNHIQQLSGPSSQKLTTAAPLVGIILDTKTHSKPPQIKVSVSNLSPHTNVIPTAVDSQNQPGLLFQNPFSPTKKPDLNAVQGQVTSSTTAVEGPPAVSSEKPGFFEIFHATEAPQTTSTTKRPPDNFWSEYFGIPSYPVMPPAVPQNPHIPTQQTPVNVPNYPFFPFNQWPGAIAAMPGAFGIPEGTVNLPTGIQYPPQFVQLPTTKVQGHNKLFTSFWSTKQPQSSQQPQNGDNSNKEVEQPQPTGAPQASQQTDSTQDNVYRPIYGQYNWHRDFPYVS